MLYSYAWQVPSDRLYNEFASWSANNGKHLDTWNIEISWDQDVLNLWL